MKEVEKIKKRKFKPRKTTEQFKKEVFDLVGDEYEVISDYLGCDNNIKFYHNICHESFDLTPHSFKQGGRCPFCANRKTYIGVNDLNTMRPDMVQYLYNKEDGFLHYGSGQIVLWLCPDCGEIFPRSISDMCRRGFSCPKCGDGISYPEKFMYNILLQIKDLDFLKREYRPKWCKYTYKNKETFGRYDIYFGYKSKKYIIELDGGLGHGNRTIDKTVKESLDIDNIKDKLAYNHNIKVIRIDCDYAPNDRFTFIKEKILNSELKNILNLNIVDFNKADFESFGSFVILSSKYWNEGLSVSEISEKLNMHNGTITNYLLRAEKYGLCDYNKEESKNRGSAHKVYCLTTNEIFNSIVEAAKKYNIEESCISKCCRRKQSYAGFYNGQKLIWMYYEDYLKLNGDKSKYIIKENKNFTKVICINTGKIFNSIKEAAEYYGIRQSGIQACCCGRYKYSGTLLDGTKLQWMYYEEYVKLNK